ncbi:CHASE2 domain-containing protein [Acidobacteria bacterium AB60]|nr:CHASE2 domain-containing protein [Acidobacteria bacterium AB60]
MGEPNHLRQRERAGARARRAQERPRVQWPVVARNVGIVVVLLVVGLYLESREDTKPASNSCELVEAQPSGASEEHIAHLALTGYRDLRSRRVTVLTLSDEKDPGTVMANLCEQRWYVAKLIDALSAMGASEIVIDKHFSPRACGPGDAGTAALVASVQHTTVPVVVGRSTHPPHGTDTSGSCLVLGDSLDFGYKVDSMGNPTKNPAALYGLTRLNSDIEKIPLGWSCYASDQAFDAGQAPTDKRVDSLSWMAAAAVDSGLRNEPRIVALQKEGHHPYTSFIDAKTMSHVDGLSVLCNSSQRGEVAARYQVDCPAHPAPEADLHGQIVVVGEDVQDRDPHTLFGANVAGVYLQANYIESLLDDRFMKAIDGSWNYIGLIAWLVCLYLIFWIQPEVALGVSVAAIVVLRYAFIEIATYRGYYPRLTILDLGAVAPVLKYIEARGHLAMHALMERHEKRSRRAG